MKQHFSGILRGVTGFLMMHGLIGLLIARKGVGMYSSSEKSISLGLDDVTCRWVWEGSTTLFSRAPLSKHQRMVHKVCKSRGSLGHPSPRKSGIQKSILTRNHSALHFVLLRKIGINL